MEKKTTQNEASKDEVLKTTKRVAKPKAETKDKIEKKTTDAKSRVSKTRSTTVKSGTKRLSSVKRTGKTTGKTTKSSQSESENTLAMQENEKEAVSVDNNQIVETVASVEQKVSEQTLFEEQEPKTTELPTSKQPFPEETNEVEQKKEVVKASKKEPKQIDRNAQKADVQLKSNNQNEPKEIKVPSLPQIVIHDIVDLVQAPMRSIVLTDQQIQQLTLSELKQRHAFLQQALSNVLDYDVVISDTNVWLELLLGHTSSHSDPRYNARLLFERQLEFMSKLSKYRGGRFMMLSETYEEIDRFATMQDPIDYAQADFTDNMVCLNTAARLAKRLILSQQRENRLRIDNIGAESHHASFADPAIIRCVATLFAEGKKVLVLTNDASVAIRSLGICDDLQRHNNITDEVWNEKYVPLRPMVFTFDDLKVLDNYTRQYHYIQMASGEPWMGNVSRTMSRNIVEPLALWDDAFRPGDRCRTDCLFPDNTEQNKIQKQVQNQRQRGKTISKTEPVVAISSEQQIAVNAEEVIKSEPQVKSKPKPTRRKLQNNKKKTSQNQPQTE